MADAERDWIQSESTAATQFVQHVTTERQTLNSNELGEYVTYVGNVAGEMANWASNAGSAFAAFATTGSTDPALAAVAGAWQQFWNDSASADQAFATAAHQLLTSALPLAKAKFTSETNAQATADKSIADAEVALMHSTADEGHQRDKDDLQSAKTAAQGESAADDAVVVSYAKLRKAQSVLSSVQEFESLNSSPAATFAAMTLGPGTGLTFALWNPPSAVELPLGNSILASLPDLDTADAVFAGWADALTFGGSTKVREWMYGEIATRNHTGTAFMVGQGIGTVHSLLMGWAGGAGACVRGAQWAKTAMSVHTQVGTVVGIANASHNIATGNGSWTDALAFAPALGRASGPVMQRLGILNYMCFVGDTPVVIREAENIALAAPALDASDHQTAFNAGWLLMAVATVSAGWLGKETLEERQRRAHRKSKPERARDYDVADPHRCELGMDSTELATAPTLSPKEFDMVCDDS